MEVNGFHQLYNILQNRLPSFQQKKETYIFQQLEGEVTDFLFLG